MSARAPVRSTSFLDSLFEEGMTTPSIPPEEFGIVGDPGVGVTKTKPAKVVVITEPDEGGTPPRPSKAMPLDPDPTPWTQVQRKVVPEIATVSTDILFPLPPPDYEGWLHTNPPDSVLYPYHLPGGKRFTGSLQPKIKGPQKPSLILEVGTHQFRKSGVGHGYIRPKRLRESLWENQAWTSGGRKPPVQQESPSPPSTTRWRYKTIPIGKHIRWWNRRTAYATANPKQKKNAVYMYPSSVT